MNISIQMAKAATLSVCNTNMEEKVVFWITLFFILVIALLSMQAID